MSRGTNNFDLLRLVAALCVLVSHAYALTAAEEPYSELTGDTLGALGVSIFFAISGYLVAQSWTRTPRLRPFAAKRALRLLPALAVCSVATVLVLGPLVTAHPLGDYFGDAGPWAYLVKSALLVEHNLVLPGVFAGNPVPFEVNGSLWTLPLEAGCYVLVAVLGVLAVQRRVWMAVLVAALLAMATTPVLDVADAFQRVRGEAGVYLDVQVVVRLAATFAAGMALWLLRERIPLRWAAVPVLAGLWALSWESEWQTFAAIPFIAYTTLVLALRAPVLHGPTRPGDVSYGLYLYAFPVQQTLVHQGTHDPGLLMLAAAPITYVLAWLSWRLVERPALRRKPAVAA